MGKKDSKTIIYLNLIKEYYNILHLRILYFHSSMLRKIEIMYHIFKWVWLKIKVKKKKKKKKLRYSIYLTKLQPSAVFKFCFKKMKKEEVNS